MSRYEADLWVITRDNLLALMEVFIKTREVIAPVQGRGGEVIFYPIESIEDVAWDWQYVNAVLPPKRFFLPQTEVIFEYRYDNGCKITPRYDDQVRMIFGIRPCDVNALVFLDGFFGGGSISKKSPDEEPLFPDSHYVRRRANTFIIAFGCHQPGENCFCVCCDAGPFLEEDYDLQLTSMNGDYAVEVGSARGLKIIYGNEHLFRMASSDELKELGRIKEDALNKFADTCAYMSKAIRKVTEAKVDDSVWEKLGKRCLDCGGCSYVCPTCCCYSVADIPLSDKSGIRTRIWDSCAFAGFTRIAGGEILRSDKKDRLKRRFFHKLSYQYIQKNKRHGCVGCGRCITTCFADISMPLVVEAIRKQDVIVQTSKALMHEEKI